MHEFLISKKKGGGSEPKSLVMAMDFEAATWFDSAKPNRVFGVSFGGPVQSSDQKKNGQQSYLQGGGQFLYTPLTSDLIFNGDFWMEMWGLCTQPGDASTAGYLNVLVGYGVYPTNGLMRWGLSDMYPTFRLPSGAADVEFLKGTTRVTVNTWNHYALGRKNGIVYLFLNGKVVASGTYTGVMGMGSKMCLGAYEDSRISGGSYAGFNGWMDRIRVYNECLHTAEFTPLTTLY